MESKEARYTGGFALMVFAVTGRTSASLLFLHLVLSGGVSIFWFA